MPGPRRVAVIDIGKTNAKLALVDLEAMAEVAVRKMPNRVVRQGLYPHHDVEGIWEFILDGLAALGREHPIDAISVTAHGATAALLDETGHLALPILDYEHGAPDELAEAYQAVRPDFTETGSPRLPAGLNLGAQLFWQQETFPDAFRNVSAVLMYPQYWSFRLCGAMASEVTSLGCHTDLWSPVKRDFSSLVERMGWRRLFPDLRPAKDRLGVLSPEVAERTGLESGTPVYCGIHDSNASLLPHLVTRKRPFAVVSTGTWAVAMAVGGALKKLDPARDTLINVDPFGDPVPSARFMGGREYETVIGGAEPAWTEADIAAVLGRRVFLLPSVQEGSGPYPDQEAEWIGGDLSPGERYVATSFYLAMMTATCLDLIGANGATVVEGPFARNSLYLDMLWTATGRDVVANTGAATGTSIGAALLVSPNSREFRERDGHVANRGANWAGYAQAWEAEVEVRSGRSP